ncbi:MAG: hypothetical protein ABW061_05095, partial [Polyangiaceae bacterium]
MADQQEIVFLVPTRSKGTTDRGSGLVRVETSARDRAPTTTRLGAITGQDVVRLEIVNGPELLLHPDCARELFAAQSGSGSADDKDVVVPTRLAWRAPNRGPSGAEQRMPDVASEQSRGVNLSEVGHVVLHAFEVVKDTVSSKGANLVAGAAAAALDARVESGLRQLGTGLPDLEQPPVALPALGGKPILVLIHGTFSTTLESFKHLWDYPELVKILVEKFDVYGFDHPTLRVSPFQNAIDLVSQLPEGAAVSFLTHSRGGLVAEAIAQLADGAAIDSRAFELEKYHDQRAELESLGVLLRARKLKVTRIVRVACPARGTLLASNRLDAYLSVLKWGLQLAQVPIAKELADFALEVAKRRTKPQELPGLEAMMPDSAFIQWLHQSDREIEGDLRVIAGDLQGDSVSSWLKTLIADAFFWTDNDLIVQTRSMYGGRPRKGGSAFFLDRGGNVTHFNYFANRATARLITRAVTEQKPEEFLRIGGLSSSGESSSGSRGGSADVITASRSKAKPAVIVLPGILGSNLKVDGERVWLGPRILNGLDRLRYGGPGTVKPDGWIDRYYDPLVRSLAESHEVIPFAFDWREPIEVEAKRLAETLRDALADRTEPVRILAHSHGGLVARAVEKVAPDVWKKFLEHEQSRLLMLGTPNGGSWAPMQVLSGDNLVGNVVALVGTLFDESRARALFAGLPGFLQLQAGLLDDKLQLKDQQTWRRLAEKDRARWQLHTPWHSLEIQLSDTGWGIPSQQVLDAAFELHSWLSAQDLRKHGNRIVTVVGKADETPSGFEISDSNGSFSYLQTERGDGTVTLANALLPGIPAYQVDYEHSKLPVPRALHAGYLKLLESGAPDDSLNFTRLLQSRGGTPTLGVSGSERAPRRMRARGWSDDDLDGLDGTLTLPSDAPKLGRNATSPTLKVSVTNGDLTFVKDPLMLGHYRSA